MWLICWPNGATRRTRSISHHYELAGRRDEAFRSSLLGAEVAVAISSHREAFELYRRAMRNLPADLPALEHADVLAAVGAEAAASDDNVAAADAYAEARQRYLAIGAVNQAAALLGPIAAARHLLGDSLEYPRGAPPAGAHRARW